MRVTEQSASRAARMAEIKRQIAGGVYESPEKLRAAIDALADSLESEASESSTSEERPSQPR